MNQAIANIIKEKIEVLDFADKIAGLTAVTYFDIKGPDGVVQKAFPIACCVTADDCKEGAYNDLMPNSAYKTVIYFEDKGISFNKSESHWKYYTSNLRLVAWLNIEKLTDSGYCKSELPCTYAAHIVAEIIRALPEFPQNISPFDHVYSEITNQEIRSNSIFSAYTYDEKHSQYLMAPFDYFALDIATNFAVCLRSTDVYDATCDPEEDPDPVDPLPDPLDGYPHDLILGEVIIGKITLDWQSTSTNQDGYKIYMSTNGGVFILKGTTTSTGFLATGLVNGSSYSFYVTAYKGVTESIITNIETVVL